MGMRIEVILERTHWANPDEDAPETLTTRVFVDGHRECGLERIWTRDEFHSYFDNIWGYMGEQIKKMEICVDFEKGK